MKKLIFILLLIPLVGISQESMMNPTTVDWYADSHNEVSMEYMGRRSSNLHLFVEGTESDVYRVSSKSLQADSLTMTMGLVYYERGVRRNVSWCDVYDVERLAPYLVADSSMGNYHHESYGLAGGYVLKSGAWRYGIAAHYRGATAFRKRDPRPQNTVSQLALMPSVLFGDVHRAIVLGLYYQYYRQHVKSQSNESSHMDFFFLTKGLGQYDYRFSMSSEDMRRYYTQQEYGVNVEAREREHLLQVSYRMRRLAVEEDDYRIPYHLFDNQYNLNYQYNPKAQMRGGWHVKIQSEYRKSDGRERIYYQEEDRNWRILAAQGKYHRKSKNASLGVAYYRKSVQWNWFGGIRAQYADETCRYQLPNAKQYWQYIEVGCVGGVRRNFRTTAVRLDMGLLHREMCNSECSNITQNSLSNWVLNEFDFYNQNLFQIYGNMSYILQIKQKEITITCQPKYIKASDNKNNRLINMKILYCF